MHAMHRITAFNNVDPHCVLFQIPPLRYPQFLPPPAEDDFGVTYSRFRFLLCSCVKWTSCYPMPLFGCSLFEVFDHVGGCFIDQRENSLLDLILRISQINVVLFYGVLPGPDVQGEQIPCFFMLIDGWPT